MKDFFKKHGDKALFALALAFLAVFLFRVEWLPTDALGRTPAIVFTQWWESDLDKLMFLAAEFEELHEIKVTINYKPYEDLRTALFALAETPPPDEPIFAGVANEVGDVVAIDPLWTSELLEKEIIEGEFSLLSFIDVLYYNVEILKDAGFSRPPKNRSEFLEYARAVVAAGKSRSMAGPRYALTVALGENNTRGVYDDVFPWIWAAGVPLVRDGAPVVTSRQVVEGLAFLAALNSEGLIGPSLFGSNLFGKDAAGKLEDFISGRAAFMVAPSAYIAQVRERMGNATTDGDVTVGGDAFGITSVPPPDNYFGRPFFATAGWAFGVRSDSRRKEEARLFADFLAGKAASFAELTSARDPFNSKVWDIAISGESARDFVAGDFAGLHWTRLEELFREGLISLFTGNATPAEAAAGIQGRWENDERMLP